MDSRSKKKFINLLPRRIAERAKKNPPAKPGFFGSLVGNFANVFENDSSDDLPPASPVAGPSVLTPKEVPYQKAGLTNLAAATRASFRNAGQKLDSNIVHQYPTDQKKTPHKKK